MSYKRVLVISHNAFGKNNNMARTLETLFCGWPSDKIAQLYFSDEIPDSEVCTSFFRISDSEVVKSIWSRKPAGTTVTMKDRRHEGGRSRVAGLKTTLIKIARYRTPTIYCMRNFIWNAGKWKSSELDAWLESFQPEVVYYASGDYAFSYKIAYHIAVSRRIPLIMGCYDDFYLNVKRTVNPFYWLNRWILMNWARKSFHYAASFTGICDAMTCAYEELFGKQGVTIYMATDVKPVPVKKNKRIIYAGNLGYGRAEQLVIMGKTLRKMNLADYPVIDVYSGEIRSEITDMLTEENGIRFHGAVSSAEVQSLVAQSMLVIHTESDVPVFTQRVKYSLSTKIADCLASGTCILAYGPADVASMKYLSDNHAAYFASCEAELKNRILEAVDGVKHADYLKNALALADRNHRKAVNTQRLMDLINHACREGGEII